jgi:hypothetical protein
VNDYPDAVLAFAFIGLYSTIYAGAFGVAFAIERTISALLRRRARAAKGGTQ